jgi:uncharacterized protein
MVAAPPILQTPPQMNPSDPELHGGFRLRPFRQASWLRGPHLQTVLGKFIRPRFDPGLIRERWETEDGDFLDLDFGPDPSPQAPLVVILHGLEGSTHRAYVRMAMAELLGRGIRPVGLNFRSCSGEPNRRPRFYHSGETEDVAWVLAGLRERFPDRKLGALGFSLGGNVLLKHLGEMGDLEENLIQAAVAISVPFDLVAGTQALESGRMGRLYTGYFLRSLRAKTQAKRSLLEGVVDLERVLAARTLREFDDAATAPLHGFPDAWTYYRESSAAGFLPRIRTPTLLLQSADDPFLPGDALPRAAVEASPWLVDGIQARGGHVGFVERAKGLKPAFWAEQEAARYLAGVLKVQEASAGAPETT